MEFITKIELLVLGWLKKLKLPQLPKGFRTWVGDNIWWMALVIAILSGLSLLFAFFAMIAAIGFLSSTAGLWVAASGASLGFAVVSAVVALVFAAGQTAVTGLAVNPLKAKQKKGWVLLFVGLLLYVVSIAVNVVVDIVSLHPFSAFGGLLFGAIGTAIGAYFLYEIRDEFAHVSRSHGVKAEATKK